MFLEKELEDKKESDVYEQEENLFFRDLSENVIQDDQILRLMSFPNVLITAHQAFFTEEALSEISRVTFDNIESFERGTELKNLVTVPGWCGANYFAFLEI